MLDKLFFYFGRLALRGRGRRFERKATQSFDSELRRKTTTSSRGRCARALSDQFFSLPGVRYAGASAVEG